MATKVKKTTEGNEEQEHVSASAKLAQKAKTKTATGKAPKADLLKATATEVEKITEVQAHSMVQELVENIEFNYFRLGGMLSVIQDKKWFTGFESFKELVQDKFGLHYRKAMYLIQIYKDLVEKEIPWSVVKDLGWTKLKELSAVLTAKNAEQWAKRAKAMTTIQLIEAIKKAKGAGKGSNAMEGTVATPDVSTMTFKVHKDQKISIRAALDKIKKETKTDVDTVALFNLCTGYNGGAVQVPVEETAGSFKDDPEAVKKRMQKEMKAMGYEEVLAVFEKAFPKLSLTLEV
jgi:hypothetical protein